MVALSKFRSAFRRQSTDDDVITANETVQGSKSEHPANAAPDEKLGPDDRDRVPDDEPHGEIQHGVSDMRAMTANWSKWSLIALFCK